MAKFYQGSEDKLLEKKLKKLFEKVHRDKPEASRKVIHFNHYIVTRSDSHPRSLVKDILLRCAEKKRRPRKTYSLNEMAELQAHVSLPLEIQDGELRAAP